MIPSLQTMLGQKLREERERKRLNARSTTTPGPSTSAQNASASHIVPSTGTSSTPSTQPASQTQPAMNRVDNPFGNIVISVTGNHGIYTHDKLKGIIEEMGARFSAKVTQQCTHLVTTIREVENNTSKVIGAYNAYTCELVSKDWLIDSREAGMPLTEADYRVKARAGNDTPTNSPGQATGIKRLLDDGDCTETAAKRPRLDLFSRSHKIIIPAHKACPFRHEYSIAVDQFGHPWDAMLVHSTSSAKSNNFFHLQLLVNKDQTEYVSWACWGRIGENPHQLKATPCDEETAKEDFERRFYDKTGFSWWTRFWHPTREGKFRFIAPSYVSRNGGEDPFNMANVEKIKYNIPVPECTLPESVQGVLALILNKEQLLATTASLEYDARKLPLGQLNKETLAQGYDVLKELSEVIRNPDISWQKHYNSPKQVTRRLSSQYFSLIPHVFGKNQPPVISAESHIEKEMALLDDLANAVIANNILSGIDGSSYAHPFDRELHQLHLDEITPLKHRSMEFKQLSRYYHDTAKGSHKGRHEIVDIFRVRRTDEEHRFNCFICFNLDFPNRRLLWHGSRTVNFAGILSQGLQVRPPGVQQTGASLGKGIYFSDRASRSLGFTSATQKNDTALLLLCDVALGFPTNVVTDNRDYRGKLEGTFSTMTASQYSSTGWTSAESIHPSLEDVAMPDLDCGLTWPNGCGEFVVYDPAQAQIRYLVSLARL